MKKTYKHTLNDNIRFGYEAVCMIGKNFKNTIKIDLTIILHKQKFSSYNII